MEKRFQFSVRNALIATAWLAVWFANWKYFRGRNPRPFTIPLFMFVFLLASMPAAAVGALIGEHRIGLLCAAASGVGLVAWVLAGNH